MNLNDKRAIYRRSLWDKAEQFIQLLANRFQVCEQIAAVKNEIALKVIQMNHRYDVLSTFSHFSDKNKVSSSLLREIVSLLHTESKRVEEQIIRE